jgi:hypothetical protein
MATLRPAGPNPYGYVIVQEINGTIMAGYQAHEIGVID